MTPTEQVRAKLDTHGVEWEAGYGFLDTSTITDTSIITKTREGNEIEIHECGDGTFTIYDLTPEQAAKVGVFLA